MKTVFEQSEQQLHEIEGIVTPSKGTLIWIGPNLYEVDHCLINFNKNFVSVELKVVI